VSGAGETERPQVYERKTLYKEVWAEPLKTVAERYGVSDVAVAKACRKLAVPLPGRGYWAKRHAGQKLPVTPLPPLPAGTPPVIYRPWVSGYRSEKPRPAVRAKIPHPIVEVSETLVEPHRLVAQADRLLGKRKSKDGIIPRPRQRCLDILVTAAVLERALLIMDALLKALEERNLKVEATAPVEEDQPYQRWIMSQTRVLVEGEWIAFAMEEQFDTIRHPAPEPPKNLQGYGRDYWIRQHTPEPDYVPNGKLALLIESEEGLGIRRTWRDAQTQRVETSLGSFISHLYATAEAIKEKRAAAERSEEEWRQQRLRRLEEEQRRLEEDRRRTELLATLERWRLARDVRAYVDDVRSRILELKGTEPLEASLEEKLAWASAYADRVDPLGRLTPRVSENDEAG
jgi:hypothetical protein